MKQTVKIFLLSLLTAFLFLGCSRHSLPTQISQDDWAGAKKMVKLSTGIEMAYVEMGNPEGEVVILQHGMTDNSRSWSLAAPYFANAGYHVYLPDLRGMGKSSIPEGFYTTITYATDMNAFFEAMGIEKAIVIGHSLGSYTVQTFGLMFPKKCSKMVLVSSTPLKGVHNKTLIAEYKEYTDPIADDAKPSEKFLDAWYECSFEEDNAEELEFDKFISNLKSEARNLPKKSWVNIFYGLVISNIGDLYQIYDTDIPVLILHGNDDDLTRTEFQPELCEVLKVPASSYKNYEGIGHNIQFEIPRQCSADILYWLENGTLPIE